KSQIFIENFPCVPVAQANIMQEIRTVFLVGHGEAIHQDDNIYLTDIVVPFPAFALWSLVSYQLATVIEHTAFKVYLGTALYLDDELLFVISRTGEVEDDIACFLSIADMLILIIDQVLYNLSSPKQVIQKCDKQVLVH